MTQQLAPLDAGELTLWLTNLTQSVDRSLRDPTRAKAADSLRDGLDGNEKLALPVLIQLAFLADCLHVAHMAILADGLAETAELVRIGDLVRVAASKYFVALPAYESFGDGAGTADEVARFLDAHRDDSGPFGFCRTKKWRGLALAHMVERSTRNPAPLQEHERMMSRVMEAVFAGRATEAEHAVRRMLRDLFEQHESRPVDEDPRAVAFCRSDGPEVFSSIEHGSHIHERDPFDVDVIHSDARRLFHRQLERATTPEQAQRGHGRTLLVLGESGAGKTHLLRALRAQVHGRRLGYVGYLQLTPDADDHARHVLRSLIDSLEQPYDAPSLAESGLMYLSDGLVEGRETVSPDELEQLRTADLSASELGRFIGTIVDRIIRSDGLERLEVDLVQALLLLQRRDPALQRRIVRFLRCDSLTQYDRELLGGLGSRDRAGDPLRTIQQLATVMYELQLAALVVVIDQVEDAVPDGRTVTRLQQALDSLRAIADAVPSSVVVIACLQDVYDAVKAKLSQGLLDRLSRDEVRLTSQRQPDEIEQMLVRRLEHLYSYFDVAWRDDDPLYPFMPAQIEAVSQWRTRDVLGKFGEFQKMCIAAGKVVSVAKGLPPPPPPPPPPPSLEKLWQETLAASVAPPDVEVLTLVAESLRGAAIERGLAIEARPAASSGSAGVIVEGKHLPRRLVALCNNAPQRGSFAAQLSFLRLAATKASAIPVALRNGDFKFQPKTKTAQVVGELVAAGGLAIPLAESQLRVAIAARTMSAANPTGHGVWQRATQPLCELPFVRQILELDREAAPEASSADPAAPSSTTAHADGSTHADPDSQTHTAPDDPTHATPGPIPTPNRNDAYKPEDHAAPESGPVRTDAPPSAVRLGVVDSMRADPIFLQLEDLKTHVAFLGSTGSGKTTAALSVVEQLLERGISVLLVDRKGDLARYASEAWWLDPAAPTPVRERKAALRKRIEIALFTPGNAHGRPLRLPLVPALADVKPQDREQLARYAAEGLGTMMGYGGKTAPHRAKTSILQCAITLHGNERDITLELLLETIDRPDPELLHLVGTLQRHFGSLSEDLQTLRIQRGSLLSGDGEPLDLELLLPPRSAGRTRLSIINTSALTEVPVLQFWVSRLLVELGRLGRKRPAATLQAAAFFDEADTYIPATSVPPTKEPMFDLLRRSRASGIGLLLATQNPGDFDYKARDNISTWLLGKVTQLTAIEKMRNLIAGYPDVGPRLAAQRTGSFFLLTGSAKRELRADRSLMDTVQLSETEVAELARATGAVRPAKGHAGE